MDEIISTKYLSLHSEKATQNQPDLLPALDAMVEPTAKGDPMSPLRWTTKSTRHLRDALNEQGFRVSHMQVDRLLHEIVRIG